MTLWMRVQWAQHCYFMNRNCVGVKWTRKRMSSIFNVVTPEPLMRCHICVTRFRTHRRRFPRNSYAANINLRSRWMSVKGIILLDIHKMIQEVASESKNKISSSSKFNKWGPDLFGNVSVAMICYGNKKNWKTPHQQILNFHIAVTEIIARKVETLIRFRYNIRYGVGLRGIQVHGLWRLKVLELKYSVFQLAQSISTLIILLCVFISLFMKHEICVNNI